MRLNGKVAFITGGSSGIGLATAKVFVREGARVAITARNRKRLDAAVAGLGKDVIGFEADVDNDAAMAEALAAVAKAFGGMDIIFANVGHYRDAALGNTTRAAFEAALATNVTGVFMTVQAALPHLRDGASIIINGIRLLFAGCTEAEGLAILGDRDPSMWRLYTYAANRELLARQGFGKLLAARAKTSALDGDEGRAAL